MNISAKTWNEYITRLARLNEKAGQLMADYIARHGTADTALLAAYAEALVTKYGEGSAELACQMYDAIAALQRADVPPAEPATPAGHSEVTRMVQATRNSLPQLRQSVSRMVKQAAADTTVKNALRDGAEWAWVPHGDTCPFCLMLASRGWQKASNAILKGGHAEHIHANCDCEFAIRFDGRTGVAGYDPERYLAQYNAAEGKTAKEKLKSLRHANYAANKDRINGQKRMAYSMRKQNVRGINDAIKHLNAVAAEHSTSGEKYGNINVDKTIIGHSPAPKMALPNSVIDHVGKNGKVETRTFYGDSGYKEKEITNHNHGYPGKHYYGEHGEHAHDYEWDKDGHLKNRTTREISEEERKENSDIL